MLVSMIIVFREAMEAGLIVGIVLAATEGVSGRARWIASGIAGGAAGAGLVALFAAALTDALEGVGQEVFTASILAFAVVMLTWHVVWMSRHAKEMTEEMERIGRAVRLGHRSLTALAVVVAVAVMREGAEVVLFLFGVAASSQTSAVAMIAGGIGGLLLASALSWLLYRGLVAIPLRRLFAVTNGLITLLAAGMAGQAAAVLHSVDLLPAWGETLWDTSALLSDDSYAGRTLHALIGYSARPSGIQVAAWLATFATIVGMAWFSGNSPKSRRFGKKGVITAAGLALGLLTVPPAQADDPPTIVFRNHRMEPNRIEVPAHTKFKLLVKNADKTAEEFESTELNREKLVAPGQTISVFLGPLEPGEYKVFGDFHQDTARGVLIAK